MVDKTYYKPGKPFCGAVKAGSMVFVSGQVPTDKDGATIGSDIQTQVTAVLNKIKEALNGVGAKVTDMVKCTVLLTDIKLFDDMNKAYIKFFEDNGCTESLPARACFEIAALVSDEWFLEVEAFAIVD